MNSCIMVTCALFHRAQNKFLKHMARRKHLGHIKFDSKKCELSVRVTVNGKEQAGAKEVQDLKQLSGECTAAHCPPTILRRIVHTTMHI